jgi:arylsulfatase A-like enzyme
VPAFEPHEAGEILARSSVAYDFCLYEYFRTDAAGHSRNRDRAMEEAGKLEEFLLGALENTDFRRTSILLTSDHGNLEDIGTRGHTHNPVPVLLWGALARRAPRIRHNDKHVDKANAQASEMAAHNAHVGQMLDALKSEGIAENTLVVWISDNGPMYAFYPNSGYSWLAPKAMSWRAACAFRRWPGGQA